MCAFVDAVTLAPLAVVNLQGVSPRALAVAPDESRLLVAFLHSGNRTTVLPAAQAPAPPAPSNPALPAAPQTSQIVPAADPRIPYTVLDHDLAEISTASDAVVAYHSGLGTSLFDVAFRADGAEAWVANTEALNLVRFEPALRGRFLLSRLTRLRVSDGAVAAFDLNPTVDYNLLPNPGAAAHALSQPMSLVAEPSGGWWVAAFASDRLARVDAAGAVQARVDLRAPGQGSYAMRGPRGLVRHPSQPILYVLNKLANTLAAVDTGTLEVVGEQPCGTFDPTPASVRRGRGALFDARLSGNGMTACGSCHIDADHDGIAWDLGDPSGEAQTLWGANLVIHDTTLRPRVVHPMKGPMMTQTLRGIGGQAPFHWRGDRADLRDFNATFDLLLGGNRLSTADFDDLAAYIESLRLPANPHRRLDRGMPTSLEGGSPSAGLSLYFVHDNHCVVCHVLPAGTDNNIDLHREVGANQPLKNPSLRHTYRKRQFNPTPGGTSVTGFGMLHDGTGSPLELPIVHPYVLHQLSTVQQHRDLRAYVLAFDTGTAPSVGFTRTVDLANRTQSSLLSDWQTLENMAAKSGTPDCDLVVHGLGRTWLFDRTSARYRPASAGLPALTRAELLALLSGDGSLSLLGVPFGEGALRSIDRDANGVPDLDQPAPEWGLDRQGGLFQLAWRADEPGWLPETSLDLQTGWTPLLTPRSSSLGWFAAKIPPGESQRFFRLRSTWK